MKNSELKQARIGLRLVERMIADEYNEDRANIDSIYMQVLFDEQIMYMDIIKEQG